VNGRPLANAHYVEPVMWGYRKGYSPGEIATGLGVAEHIVRDVIALYTTPAAPPMAPRPREIAGVHRTDPQYRAWLRARDGARATLKAERGR
jgi:hypothetical protein